MAAQTPPPAERARTPPTPLHGPMFDSPRRSSRIHNKQKHSPGNLMDSPPPFKASSRKRPAARPSASQALSPPSSPVSPDQRAQLARNKQARSTSHFTSSDAKPSNARHLAVDQAFKMYPTPSKTPRKRAPRADFGNAARVLFHDRETVPNEIMPTPSKSKKGKQHTAFSLESFEEEQRNGSKVQIYTDSKERMPELNEDEDNPFVVKKANTRAQTNVSARTTTRAQGRPKHGMNKEVDEAVENGKGIVYTFRGRKIFRKFDEDEDGQALNDGEDPAASFSDQDFLRRQAGHESTKRMTRSSIKPRLLFPPKEAPHENSELDEDPDEATTDIETPVDASNNAEEPGTPQNPSFGISTPPVTEQTKKRSPFDSWPRTKPGRSGKAKRSGSPLERGRGAAEKRSRSAQPGS